MNRERLKILRDHLASLPDERVDMRWVLTDGQVDRQEDGIPCNEFLADCGTAACIVGWSGALFAPGVADYGSDSATKDLSLTRDQGWRLFLPFGFETPGRFTRTDAIAAIDSMLANPDDDALPVWPDRSGVQS